MCNTKAKVVFVTRSGTTFPTEDALKEIASAIPCEFSLDAGAKLNDKKFFLDSLKHKKIDVIVFSFTDENNIPTFLYYDIRKFKSILKFFKSNIVKYNTTWEVLNAYKDQG